MWRPPTSRSQLQQRGTTGGPSKGLATGKGRKMAREGQKHLDATSLRLADWAGEESIEGRDGERPRTAVVVDEDASWIEAVERLLDRLGVASVWGTEVARHPIDT